MWSVGHQCVTFDLVELQPRLERSVDMPKITQQKAGSRSLNFLPLIPFHFPMNDWELGSQLPGPGSVLWLPWPNTSLGWGQTMFSHSIMV